jgi:cell division septum initiation protein DivIVA
MIKTIQPKTMHGERVYKKKKVDALIHNVIDNGHLGKHTATELARKHKEIEDAIEDWNARLSAHRDRMMTTETEIAKVCKATSASVRTAANHLGEGLVRLEKTANFDKLERHVALLERASAALQSLAELEKNGRLAQIMRAMK